MSSRAPRLPFHPTAFAFLLVATACGDKAAVDPNNREVSWIYGPTKGGASAEHVRGTGKEGGAAVAKGWQCRLQDGKRLTVKPFELAESHALFGKVVMVVGLYDKNGKDLTTVTSTPLTAENAAFTFELTDAVAKELWDLVIWYRKV